jgi:signal transduction histidine kinase
VSTASFTVLPSFYQTTWFAAVCVLATFAVLWFAYRVRVRTITREVRARAEERADERIRIARELHDTLLQGVQGLLLTFHVASQKVAADAESKSMLERALAAADRIIIEGRNRVSRLRSENLRDSELVSALENVCNDLKGGEPTQCSVVRHGISETLLQHVAEEVFYVAREALTNAFRHSNARHIALDLAYGRRFFMLTCKDDGRGFDLLEPDRSGHWGIQGMAERVQKLGGHLDCISSPGQGTEIRVSIPSYMAYPNQSRAMHYLRALVSSDIHRP